MSTSEPALAVTVAALAMTPGTSAGPEVADQHAVHALQPRSSHTPRQVTLDSSPECTPRTIALRDSLSGSPTPSSTSNQFSSDAASTPSTSPDCVTPVATTSATIKPSSPSYTHLRAPSDEGGAPISPLFPSPSSPFRPPPCLDAEVPLAIPSPRLRQKDRLSISGGFASGASTPIPSRPPSRPTSAIQMRRGRSGSTASRKSNALASPQPSEDAAAWPPAKVGLGDYFSSSAGAASTSKVRYSTEVVVRDFAFERSDPRFKGLADPNQNSKSSQASARSHLSADDELGNENFASSGSSAFSWGFVTSHETDFPAEDDSQLYSEEELDDEDDVPPDFVRGIYQALFDFEPELDTEMVMKTGDVVSVVARKCAGWVQAGRIVAGEITGEIGLVPENYLVLLERDDDDGWGESDEEEEEGEEGEQDGVAAAPVLAEAPQPTDTVS